jgi:hypothetical protein
MKPIDPSPTPQDRNTWGFYCDTCDKFFDLVTGGKVWINDGGYFSYEHKACGQPARYIGYVRALLYNLLNKGGKMAKKIFKIEAQGDTVYVQASNQEEACDQLTEFMGPIPHDLLTFSEIKKLPKGEVFLR